MWQFHSQQFKHQQEAFEPVTQMQVLYAVFHNSLDEKESSFADN